MKKDDLNSKLIYISQNQTPSIEEIKNDIKKINDEKSYYINNTNDSDDIQEIKILAFDDILTASNELLRDKCL